MKSSIRRLLARPVDVLAKRVSNHLLREPIVDSILGSNSLAVLDIRKFAQIATALEAGEFYNKHLYNVPYYHDFLEHVSAMAVRGMGLGGGMILEFGVASGRSLNVIAKATGRPVVGFDSWKGLPKAWRDGVPAGAYAFDPPHVPANATLVNGLIEETLPVFLGSHPGEINFIHVDTDLYEPARVVLQHCAPRMRNTVIVFDELINYSGWRDHEYKAWTEFTASHSAEFDWSYIGLGGSTAVSVLVTRK